MKKMNEKRKNEKKKMTYFEYKGRFGAAVGEEKAAPPQKKT